MNRIAIALASIFGILIASPASAQVVITQAKALAGNVTPGDAAGYPITLSLPGAYVLGSNLTVPGGTYGVYAGVDNIDIDLKGFVISGGGVATYAFVTAKAQGRIRAGVIKAFRGSGIYLRGGAWTIEDMKILQNGGKGIDAQDAAHLTLRNSLVSSNVSEGIYAGEFAHVESSTIVSNHAGVQIGDNSVVRSSTVSQNSTTGITVAGSAMIEGNDISNNGYLGVILFDGGFVTSNSFKQNFSYAVRSQNAAASLSNNYMRENSISIDSNIQTLGGIDAYGNICVGEPCFVP